MASTDLLWWIELAGRAWQTKKDQSKTDFCQLESFAHTAVIPYSHRHKFYATACSANPQSAHRIAEWRARSGYVNTLLAGVAPPVCSAGLPGISGGSGLWQLSERAQSCKQKSRPSGLPLGWTLLWPGGPGGTTTLCNHVLPPVRLKG